MGARSLALPQAKPKPVFDRYKRGGTATDAEKALVKQFVQDQPREVTPAQTRALAKVLRRSTDMVKSLIADAREEFVTAATDYVRMHKQGVQDAIATGDPKGLDAGIRGAQWALENISMEGQRIVDKVAKGDSGTKVMIGVKLQLGGLTGSNPPPASGEGQTSIIEAVVEKVGSDA